MSRIERKEAQTVGDALKEFLKAYHLTPGLNTQRIFAAWDDASGAASFTIKKFFRDGKLYITLNSSVVRSQLSFQKKELIAKINAILEKDHLFSKDEPKVGYVNELILK